MLKVSLCFSFPKLRFILILCALSTNYVYAASSSTDVSKDLNGLINQINQVNSDLNTKQKQQRHLSKAINDSDQAINQSETLLSKLKQQRDIDVKQLAEIESVLPQLTKATEDAQTNVKTAIDNIYKELRLLESNDNSSILNGNDNLEHDRKKLYLVKLLQAEEKKYVDLQAKLTQLNALNKKINDELDRIDKELGTTTKRKSQLQVDKQAKIQQVAVLQQNISKEKVQLANLKAQQAQLNKLLQNIQAREAQDKAKQNTPTTSTKPNKIAYEDNSPFLARKLSKPVEGGKVSVGFGAVRGGVPNNGVLFSANNLPVHAISTGRVLFSGTLPGFGQMVVVDNGDNYVSIYGGILPQVTKNQQLASNQVIGSSGTTSNQPMGGVYFELRHYGKPVNPSKLVD